MRERARKAMTDEIVHVARDHLATDGAAGLSLRAVARDMGMASSAVYRYFPSRDDLLTRLIVEAYDSLGTAVEQAEARVPREDLDGRFRAVARAVRRWAMEHDHEYALLYGSPVPGYRAPEATIPPATRVPNLLIQIVRDAVAAGRVPRTLGDVPDGVVASMAPLMEAFGDGETAATPDLVVRSMMAWVYIFGAVSFDLFGHRHNVVAHDQAIDSPFFDHEVDRLIDLVGLTSAG